MNSSYNIEHIITDTQRSLLQVVTDLDNIAVTLTNLKQHHLASHVDMAALEVHNYVNERLIPPAP
jgi:hypothetical protein